jgi:hypothetical protein
VVARVDRGRCRRGATSAGQPAGLFPPSLSWLLMTRFISGRDRGRGSSPWSAWAPDLVRLAQRAPAHRHPSHRCRSRSPSSRLPQSPKSIRRLVSALTSEINGKHQPRRGSASSLSHGGALSWRPDRSSSPSHRRPLPTHRRDSAHAASALQSATGELSGRSRVGEGDRAATAIRADRGDWKVTLRSRAGRPPQRRNESPDAAIALPR